MASMTAPFYVYIQGAYHGTFQTFPEAMKIVEERALGFNFAWEIKNGHQEVLAKG